MDNRLLRALLFFKVEEYQQQGGQERPELLLARAGLEYQEIADILDKKPDAVRMYLKRNKIVKKAN